MVLAGTAAPAACPRPCGSSRRRRPTRRPTRRRSPSGRTPTRLSRRRWKGSAGQADRQHRRPRGARTARRAPRRTAPARSAPPAGNSTWRHQPRRRSAKTPSQADQQPRRDDDQHPVEMQPVAPGRRVRSCELMRPRVAGLSPHRQPGLRRRRRPRPRRAAVRGGAAACRSGRRSRRAASGSRGSAGAPPATASGPARAQALEGGLLGRIDQQRQARGLQFHGARHVNEMCARSICSRAWRCAVRRQRFRSALRDKRAPRLAASAAAGASSRSQRSQRRSVCRPWRRLAQRSRRKVCSIMCWPPIAACRTWSL